MLGDIDMISSHAHNSNGCLNLLQGIVNIIGRSGLHIYISRSSQFTVTSYRGAHSHITLSISIRIHLRASVISQARDIVFP